MANKIPSRDKNSQLEALRPGLTDDVADPAAAKDSVNEGAWKLHDEHRDYQPKFLAPGKKELSQHHPMWAMVRRSAFSTFTVEVMPLI